MNLAREPRFRLGSLEVRPATREVVHTGGRETLEPRVMSVLVALAQANGEVVTRDDLTRACWEGRVVSDDAINRVISRIRRVSDLTGGKDFTLETITKVGYRLTVLGQAEAADAPKPPARLALLQRTWILAAGGVAAALAMAAVVWWTAFRQPDWSPDPSASLTLAVLPFDNLGAESADDVIALGLSREIRNTLSRVRGLRVVSDSSSFAIASDAMTSTDMGQRLKADLLLDGSLERIGDSVRLSVELVDVWDGVNLWTGALAGPAADLSRLREQMASQVFEQIVVKIGPNRLERLAEPRQPDPRAYRALIEATELLERVSSLKLRGRTEEARKAGVQASILVDEALAIEPNSAMALFLKSRMVAMGATPELGAENLPQIERQARAADYLRRALAADPDYAPALGALGEYYRRYEWRWSTAQAMLVRAVALDPNQADVRLSYSYYLSGAGRCLEALEHARAAIEIDPEFGWRTMGVPRALKCVGRHAESEAAYLDALRQDPANPVILREIYLNHLVRGDADGLERVRAIVRDEIWGGAPSESVSAWLGWTEQALVSMRGDQTQFARLIEPAARNLVGAPRDDQRPLGQLLAKQGDIMWVSAVVLAFTGQTDEAIEMLRGAVAAGTLYIPETMPYGAFEFTPEMRADPRYQAIWRS